MTDKKAQSPFDNLTEAQRLRLSNLTSEIRFDKLTASFLLESRGEGTKKSSFYSASVSRAELGDESPRNWTIDDIRIIRSLLSKHVVATCYDDAVRRHQMTSVQAREEATSILAAYDALVAKNLMNGSE